MIKNSPSEANDLQLAIIKRTWWLLLDYLFERKFIKTDLKSSDYLRSDGFSQIEVDRFLSWAIQGVLPATSTNFRLCELVPVFDTQSGSPHLSSARSYATRPLQIKEWPLASNKLPIGAGFEALEADVSQLFQSAKSGANLINAHLGLLSKYGSYIALDSSQKDISIFEACKSAVGFGQAIDGQTLAGESKLLFVGGDVSGIQKFIYDTESSGAARSLKGRSFYLQALVDAIIYRLLESAGLNRSAIIYSSGGGFYLLAPVESKKTIEDVRDLIINWLYADFGISLYLCLSTTELQLGEIANGKAQHAWTKLSKNLSAQKTTKFAKLIIEGKSETGSSFFAPREVVLSTSEPKDSLRNPASFEGLGRSLKSARMMRLRNTNEFISLDRFFQVETILGELDEKLEESNSEGLSLSFNSFDFPKTATNGWWEPLLYGGNDYPTIEKTLEPKTFEDLAKSDDGSFNRLGVLRMDVDGLGSLFIKGFGEGRNSFARYSQLSKTLDWFFRGYLNTLWKQEPFCSRTQIIYSGGDDLFLVGRWIEMIEMADLIQSSFRQYTGSHPSITLSGGLSIIGNKFPIIKGAAECEEAESMAKSHEAFSLDGSIKQKDAITLLGMPLSWETEFQIVKHLSEKLIYHIKCEVINRALLMKLQHYGEVELKLLSQMSREDVNNHPMYLQIIWQSAYDFARFLERMKKPNENETEDSGNIRGFLAAIRLFVFSGSIPSTADFLGDKAPPGLSKFRTHRHSALQLVALASRLTELQLRTTSEKAKNE